MIARRLSGAWTSPMARVTAVIVVGIWATSISLSCRLFLNGPLSAWLAGHSLLVVITPILLAGLQRLPDQCAAIAGITAFSLLGWTGVGRSDGIHAWLVTQVVAVSVSFVLGTWATGRLLQSFKIVDEVAVGTVILLTSAWLTWPFWLTAAPPLLVRLHPLLAINGILADLGIWTEQPVFYRVSSLGQDVAYAVPRSPWLCIAANCTAAIIAFGSEWAWFRFGRRPRWADRSATDPPMD